MDDVVEDVELWFKLSKTVLIINTYTSAHRLPSWATPEVGYVTAAGRRVCHFHVHSNRGICHSSFIYSCRCAQRSPSVLLGRTGVYIPALKSIPNS